MRIFEDGLQIALNAGHRCLQFVGYILRELSFEYILLLLRTLQLEIKFDDARSRVAELIVGEIDQFLGVQSGVVVGACGEIVESRDALAQAMHEAVEHKGEQEHHTECEPDVMLVGAQTIAQAHAIGQCRAYNIVIVREIGSAVEIVVVERGAVTVDNRTGTLLQRLRYLGAVEVIGHRGIVLLHIVEKNLPILSDDGDAQSVGIILLKVLLYGRHINAFSHVDDGIVQLFVERLQAQIHRANLVLLLAVLLKDDERYRKEQEQRQHAEIESVAYG